MPVIAFEAETPRMAPASSVQNCSVICRPRLVRSSSVMPMVMKKRTDVVTDGDNVDAVLHNAPNTDGKYFLVPKVVE